MNNEILILKSDKDDFEKEFIDLFIDAGYDCQPIYKPAGTVGYYLRVLWNKYLNLPFKSLTYGYWKKNLSAYKTVILFDRILSWDIIRFLKKEDPDLRVIVWYWNPVDRTIALPNPEYGGELWTFDPADQQKYGMHLNTQFFRKPHWYADSFADSAQKGEGHRIFFAGSDKGRAEEVLRIIRMLEKMGVEPDVSIIEDKTTSKIPEIQSWYQSELIPYSQMLQRVGQASILLDVPQKGQRGITLRTLEAQFFMKKLITTNEAVQNCCFYHPDNILILKNDTSAAELKSFIETPCNTEAFHKAEFYDIPSWISRFDEGEIYDECRSGDRSL